MSPIFDSSHPFSAYWTYLDATRQRQRNNPFIRILSEIANYYGQKCNLENGQYYNHVQGNMVGYEKSDTMTANQKLVAGCVSGVMTRFITQPLDVVKIRTQLQKRKVLKSDSWFKTTRRIFREEGISALWHGHNLGQIHSILAVSSQFFVYEMSTKYVSSVAADDRSKKLLVFLSGIFAGCCSATLVIPLEVIRVRQMLVQSQYKGLFNGAKEVYSSGGILAFYEGLNASLLQMGPQVGIAFSVFSFVQPLILGYFHTCDGACVHAPGNAHKPEYLLLASTVAGSLAGLVSKTITYPFDLAKRRMQIGSHKEDTRFQIPSTSKNLIRCYKLSDCLLQTYRKEGIFGFYRGWKVTVYKAQLTGIVAFTTYELMCYSLRQE